jgi:hypothetical protein
MSMQALTALAAALVIAIAAWIFWELISPVAKALAQAIDGPIGRESTPPIQKGSGSSAVTSVSDSAAPRLAAIDSPSTRVPQPSGDGCKSPVENDKPATS